MLIGPNWSICASECHNNHVLKNVNTIPGHRETTLAIALPLLAYLIGLPPYSLNSLPAVAASVPATNALFAATMYVYASAHDSVRMQASARLVALRPEEVGKECGAEDGGDEDADEGIVGRDADEVVVVHSRAGGVDGDEFLLVDVVWGC